MSNNQYFKTLASLKPHQLKEAIMTFEQVSRDSSNAQKQVLMDILNLAKDTEIGKKYNFSEIKSIKDYQSQVPIIEFDDISEEVEKLLKGEKDILFNGDVEMFTKTTGTTGKTKDIPQSALSNAVLDLVGSLRTAYELALSPVPLEQIGKVLTMVPAKQVTSEGGHLQQDRQMVLQIF